MRRSIKLKLIYGLSALLAAGALLLWIFQAGVAQYILKKRFGDILKVERVEGGIAGGFRLYGVRAKTAAFSAYVERAGIRPDLGGVLRGKMAVRELIITGVVIKIVAGQAAPGIAKPAPGLPSGLEVQLIRVEDGRVEFMSEAGMQNAVTDISGEFHIKNGSLTVRSLRGKFLDADIVLKGEYSGKGVTASGQVSSDRPDLLIRFDYTLAAHTHALRAEGRLKDASVRINASSDGESRWKLDLVSSGLPLSLVREDLPDLYSPASFRASGRYFALGKITGLARLRTALPRGAVLEGRFKISPDVIRLDASLSSPEAEGILSGEYAAGAFSGVWGVSSKKAFSLLPEGPLSVYAFKGKGKISGRAAAPVLSWDVSVSSAAYGPARADMLMTKGEFRFGAGSGFKMTAEVNNISSGRTALGSVSLKTEGMPYANTLNIAVSSAYLRADLAGTSSLKDGVWKAVWTSLLLKEYPAWRLCAPFSTLISKAGYQLADLCVSDGKARAALTAKAAGAAIEALDLALSNFPLETISALPLSPGGLVDARAVYDKGAGDGTMDFSATALRVRDMDFGSVLIKGKFNKDRLDIRQLDWNAYDGTLTAAGTVAFGGKEPDLHFVVTASTMNVAPLLVFSSGIKADKLVLNGAAEIELKGSAFTNRGLIRFESPLLEIIPLGLKFTELRVAARGEESLEASISASARTRSGGITANGRMGALGPDMVIKADKMFFAAPMGLSGIADGALDFRGSWKKPVLSGMIDFPECRFDMEKWRGSPPPGPRNRFYESLGMDIRVRSVRNAWYRDPPNSIEARGDLILKKTPYDPLAVIGSVEALKGFYTYLGNTFTIQSGTLIFGGEIPPDPRIEVSAANAPRERLIKIYLNAAGTFRNPKIELSSDPAMEQRDIMSYLLTGKPLYEASKRMQDRTSNTGADGSQVAAANIVAGYLSQKAAGTLVRKLDIDVLNVRMTSDRAADITVGRYLTTDLFISYGQVLSPGGEKKVVAEYTITPWWSLEGKNSSQGNYVVDLIFRFAIR